MQQILRSFVAVIASGGGVLAAEKEKEVEVPVKEVIRELRGFGEKELDEGRAVYGMVCAACHGDGVADAPLSGARVFSKEDLQNGSGVYEIYQTLTEGFNNMPAQVDLTNLQKMAVIHYLRETFLNKRDPKKGKITDAYLNALPADVKLKWKRVDKKGK